MFRALITFLLLFWMARGDSKKEPASRIVGGEDAPEGSAPYMASLRFFFSEQDIIGPRHFCGGSILNQKWILSAAHCTDRTPAQMIKVIVGTIKRTSGGTAYDVEFTVNHEDYSPNTMKNDISLLKIIGSIQIHFNIHPIQLPTRNIRPGELCTLTGWGKTDSQWTSPENLQVVHNLTKISVEECNSRLAEINAESLPISDEQLCTLTKEGVGSCNDDSGGPLISDGVQVGIVSWGFPCATGKPDVFTRVYPYVKWINNYIQ